MSDVRLPRPAMREEFRKRLRADLVSEAVALAEERRLRGEPLWGRVLGLATARLRAVAVAATMVAVLLAGTGAAAAGSLPGDPAYPLKRAAEQIELALADSDDAKVRVLTAQAERRLDELGRSADRADKAPTASAEYAAAVQRLAAAVAALRTGEPGTKREAAEQVVEAARDKHVQVLEGLKERLPDNAKERVERALEEHQKIGPAKDDKDKEREPRSTDRPGAAPRATETGRGGRPSATPPAKR